MMDKQSKALMKLSSIGWIHGIHVKQVQTGTDTAATMCVITGSSGVCKGLWSTYAKYLDVRVGHNMVAEIKREYAPQIAQWVELEAVNQQELAEYERLRGKFG